MRRDLRFLIRLNFHIFVQKLYDLMMDPVIKIKPIQFELVKNFKIVTNNEMSLFHGGTSLLPIVNNCSNRANSV